VQRRVDVAAAHRLDEGAGHVVVLVARSVVAHRGLRHCLLDVGQGDLHGALVDRAGRHRVEGDTGARLERGQRPAGVAARDAHDVVEGLVGQGVGTVEAPLVVERGTHEVGDVGVGERLEGDEHRGARGGGR
jgi:hypothetical protein